MIVETKSGSHYEFDAANQRVRRLKGQSDPTPRMGVDGQWKNYSFISDIQIGEPVMIVWCKQDTPLLPDTQEEEGQLTMPTTITNLVVKIFQDGDTPS